jgi:protein phosphatase 1 regulatory subunit 16A
LHIAACNGYTNVLSFLLQLPNIQLNVKDSNGNTPLHLAAFFMQYEAAMQLALAGADLQCRNRLQQKPIVVSEDATMIRLLSAFEKHVTLTKADSQATNTSKRARFGSIGRSTRDKSHSAAHKAAVGESMAMFTKADM